MKSVFVVAFLVGLTGLGSSGCERESSASEPRVQVDTAKAEAEVKKGSTDGAEESGEDRTLYSFSANRHLAHRFDPHGLVLDLGEAGALKYKQGRWNSTWYAGRDGDGFRYTYPRGVSGTLRFGLWVPGAEGRTQDWKLTIRLKPEGSQRCDLFLSSADGDEKKFASLNSIEDGWKTYTVSLPDGLEIGQEHTLRLHFSRSRSIKGGRSAAAIDWIRIGPSSSDDGPSRLKDLVRDDAIQLPAGHSLAWYTKPAQGSAFTASVDGRVNFAWDDQEREVTSSKIDVPSKAVRLVVSAVEDSTVRSPRLVAEPLRAESTENKRPKYVLVWIIDTLRADHLSVYNPKTDVLTPNLSKWARTAAVFQSATCQGNSSLPTSAAIFTSAYAPNHGLTSDKARLPADRTLLGEAFKGDGWATGLFSSNGYVSKTWGFARGFDVEVNPIREGRPSDTEYLWPEARDWLKERVSESGEKPVFLYVNTIDPHVPYDPPAEMLSKYHSGGRVGQVNPRATGELLHDMAKKTKRLTAPEAQYLYALYKGEISYNDHWFGVMLDDLETMGILDETLIVVSSDHGEEFGEYGRWGHGVSVNQELVDIPLIVGFSPWTSSGLRIEDDVEIVDLMPTLLDAAGIERPTKLQGASLVDLIRRPGVRHPRAAFAYHNDFLRSARVGKLKYQLFNGDNDRLYHLSGPSGGWDRDDRADREPVGRRMMRDLMAFQLALDTRLDKSKHGGPTNHADDLAAELDSKPW